MSSQLGLNVARILSDIPDRPLQDPGLQIELSKATLERPIQFDVAGARIEITPSTEATIEAFNAPGDVDRDGIVANAPPATSASSDGSDPTRPTPVLFLGKDAWLKYAVRAEAKASGSGEMPYLAASASAETSALVADYRRHPLTQSARAAVLADVAALRVPFLAEHVTALGVDDSLVLRVGANLATRLTLRWTDVFATHLSALGKLLPAGTPLGLTIEAGASVSGSVRIADTFQLVFWRHQPGRVRVLVQKAATREAKHTASISVTVEASDPAAFQQALDGTLDALVGSVGVKRFEALLDKLVLAQLAVNELPVLQRTLDRLGLAHLEADPTALKRAWEQLQQKARDILQKIATQKMTAGFRYEYDRIAENATLVDLDLTDARVKELHPQLVTLQLAGALGRLAPGELKRYLHQRSTTVTEAWGFSLDLGAWSVLGSKDGKTLREVRLYNTPDHENGPQKVAFLGTRLYEGQLFGEKVRWGGELKAAMSTFRQHPTAADLAYGVYLHLARGNALSADELRQAVDEAAAWGAFPTSEADAILARIKTAAGNQPVRTRLELRIDEDRVCRELLRLVASAAVDPYARALCRALPSSTNAARATPENRIRIYGPLWKMYLTEKGKDWTPARAAREAEHHLAKRHPEAADFRLWEQQQRAGSLADVLEKESRSGGPNDYLGLYRKWSGMTSAVQQLHQGIQGRADWSCVKRAFQSVEDLWKNAFELKAFGALLLDLAAQTTAGVGAIERTFTVTLGQGDAARNLTTTATPST
ncbi:hypothetical protein [Chondromyces crocatus]|uniref:Uncharacterized protein n=1 Tax=Chondromyces crocatus TaxID=52 RepID=A0A0K1EQN7_CHOCO|nr:hypothetical protein [Chondromyces crocatus]AKT43240.1 uncharacterized protein CMC5_074710 [Chondromyces crocatus]